MKFLDSSGITKLAALIKEKYAEKTALGNYYNLGAATEGATVISANTDLDTIVAPGVYVCQYKSIAETLINCPVDYVGFKLVVQRTGYSSDSYLVQTIIANGFNFFVRYNTSEGSAWVEWKRIAVTNKINANALINELDTGADAPADNDYYVVQYKNGGTTNTNYYRKKISTLYDYIKSKADSVYAAISHNHDERYPIINADINYIPLNSNLNDYITSGTYKWYNDGENYPTNAPCTNGILFVIYTLRSRFITQIVLKYNGSKIYVRDHDAETEVWSDWKTISYSDENVTTTKTTLPSTATNYYLVGSDTENTNTDGLVKFGYDARFYMQAGTTSTEGQSTICLGNTTESGTSGNTTGGITLYNNKGKYGHIRSHPGDTINRTLYTPKSNGTLVVHTTDTKNGNTNKPVYITADGVATAISYTIDKAVPSDAVFTDTKNTAGSTDTSSKIFLVGATSQAANPQTYSHDTAFVDANGRLNSAAPASNANDTTVATTKWVKDQSYITGVAWGDVTGKPSTFTPPTASNSTLGGIKVGTNLSIDGNGILSATDTTYNDATQSTHGLMSSEDKTKLNGIESGAQVNTITGVKGNSESSYRTGNVNITAANIGAATSDHTHNNYYNLDATTASGAIAIASGTDLNTLTTLGTYVSSSMSNTNSLTNCPITGVGFKLIVERTGYSSDTYITQTLISYNNQRFIRGKGSATASWDSTWKKIAFTDAATTSVAGLMSAADKTKLDGIETGANNYELPTASSDTLGGIKVGTNLSISSGVLSASDAKVTSTNITLPASNTSYYLTASSTESTNTDSLTKFGTNARLYGKTGTTSAEGTLDLCLGNTTVSGTANNVTGRITLFNNKGMYTCIAPHSDYTSNSQVFLPKSGGTLVAHTTDTKIGDTNKPVYITADGVATAVTSLDATILSGTIPTSCYKENTDALYPRLDVTGLTKLTNENDLNDIIEPGTYYWSTDDATKRPANIPCPYGKVIVLYTIWERYIIQLAFSHRGNIYTRQADTKNNIWTEWKEIASTADITTALDSYVTLSTTQTISNKTFTTGFNIQNSQIDKGFTPSSTKYGAWISVFDKNGTAESNRIAAIGQWTDTYGSNVFYFGSYKPEAGSNTSSGLSIIYPKTGDPYATVMNTYAASDNSGKVATTAFVKRCVPTSVGSATQPVYTDANGVVTACTYSLDAITDSQIETIWENVS